MNEWLINDKRMCSHLIDRCIGDKTKCKVIIRIITNKINRDKKNVATKGKKEPLSGRFRTNLSEQCCSKGKWGRIYTLRSTTSWWIHSRLVQQCPTKWRWRHRHRFPRLCWSCRGRLACSRWWSRVWCTLREVSFSRQRRRPVKEKEGIHVGMKGKIEEEKKRGKKRIYWKTKRYITM